MDTATESQIVSLGAQLAQAILTTMSAASLTTLEQNVLNEATQELASIAIVSIAASPSTLASLKWRHDAAMQGLNNMRAGVAGVVQDSLRATLPKLLLAGIVEVAGIAGGPIGEAWATILAQSVTPYLWNL